MLQRILVGLGIAAIALMVVGLGHGFAQEPEAEGPYSYTKTSTKEGFFRADLPVGEYACQFIDSYDDSDDDYPSNYIDSTLWLKDEGVGSWSAFSRNSIKFVSVTPPRPADYDELAGWAAELAEAFSSFNIASWGQSIEITDTTPRVEIDLSRGFRRARIEWTFQCVEFEWPD